jgi:hypothetical protein
MNRLVCLGRIVLLTPCLSLVTSGSLDAQISLDQRVCAACEVGIQRLIRLGGSDDNLVAASDVVARDPTSGSFYVSHQFSAGISVFSPNGRYLRTIGREGQGPGEFKTVMDIVFANGRTYYADRGNRRISIGGPDGVENTANLPIIGSPRAMAIADKGHALLVAANIRTKDLFGYAIHTFDLSGRRLASFDTTSGLSLRPNELNVLSRRLASASDTSVWAAHTNEYRLQLWSYSGQLKMDLFRTVDWFPPWRQPEPISPSTDGRLSAIQDIFYDAHTSYLWVLIQVPDNSDRWLDGLAGERGSGGKMYYGPRDLNRVYDTIIECIDVDRQAIVATTRVDPALRRFLGNGYVISHVAPDSLGLEYIDVWSIRLLRTSDPGERP